MSTSQPRLRSLRGCWTCRLRRKKCDETKPVCSTCSALEISCLYSEAKPKWMDGGVREKEKAQEVKRIIKERAGERRDRKWAVLLNSGDAARDGTVRGESEESAESLRISQGEGGVNKTSGGPRGMDMGEVRAVLPTPDMSPGNMTTGQDLFEDTRATTVEEQMDIGSWTTEAPVPTPETTAPRQTAHNPALASSWLETASFRCHSPPQPQSKTEPETQLQDTSFADMDRTLERETGAIMTYLDHALPYFHPFYHPSLITGSRGWQLFLLLRHKTIFHTALSLSSYFLSVAFHASRNDPILESQTHTACQKASWADLLKHQDLAIRRLRDDVKGLGEGTDVREGLKAMVGIVQLLEFEIVIANRPDLGSGVDDEQGDESDAGNGLGSGKTTMAATSWLPHLNAALELFGQIMDREEREEKQRQQQQRLDGHMGNDTMKGPWHTIMKQLSYSNPRASGLRFPIPPSFKPPLSNTEMALHFNTARMLYIDIVASTSLERSPLLSKYHAEILCGPNPAIKLEEYIGLQNWVVLATAQVVELAVWKRQMKNLGQLSVVELVKRASKIEGELRRGLDGLSGVVDSALRANGYVNNFLAVISGQDLRTLDNPSGMDGNGSNSTRAYPTPPPSNTTHFTQGTSQIQQTSLPPPPPIDIAIHTTLWAHATLIYLALTVSGMQPQTPEIQSSLQHILTLFTSFCPLSPPASQSNDPSSHQQPPNPRSCQEHASPSVTTTLHLRTAMWPFVIAGIVTTQEDQKEVFPRLVGGMGDLSIFGSAREALRIVRRVWERRDGCKAGDGAAGSTEARGFVDAEDWSVAGCLNILGRPSLLV